MHEIVAWFSCLHGCSALMPRVNDNTKKENNIHQIREAHVSPLFKMNQLFPDYRQKHEIHVGVDDRHRTINRQASFSFCV